VCCVGIENSLVHVRGADDTELAQLLIELLRAGRAVVLEHQSLINDASKGEKGFTDKLVVSEFMVEFEPQGQSDVSCPGDITQSGVLMAIEEYENEGMLDEQPTVNKQDIAFNGFVPLALSSEVKQECSEKTRIRINGP
jgi:hypothetical protein